MSVKLIKFHTLYTSGLACVMVNIHKTASEDVYHGTDSERLSCLLGPQHSLGHGWHPESLPPPSSSTWFCPGWRVWELLSSREVQDLSSLSCAAGQVSLQTCAPSAGPSRQHSWMGQNKPLPSVQPVTEVPWWGPSSCAAGAGSRASLRQRARLWGCVSCCCNKPRDRGASPAGAVLSVSPASFVGLTLPAGYAALLASGASPRPPGASPVSPLL